MCYVNNNLSKKLFVKIGDTSNGNHSQIDQIADFYGITWVNSNYNSTFGGQWCFIDSTIIDNSGPYAMQRIMSCENAAVLATRYCTKGTWGAWNVGVTKSDLEKSGVCIGGIHIHSFVNKSSATTKKFTPTNANSHMAGLLIVDQNNRTDVYSIGRISGVQPLLKKSDADLPTISSGVLNVSLVAWGSIAFVSFDEFTIS